MPQRAKLKQGSLVRILDSAATRLRVEGIAGAAIAAVMKDAGLTHGTFYAHFADKEELATRAFRHALTKGRPRWIGTVRDRSWRQRLGRLANNYLDPDHRDNLATSCAFSALGADAARAPQAFRDAYAQELHKSLNAICDPIRGGPDAEARFDDAIRLMALCVGGLTLARAAGKTDLSERILFACRDAVNQINLPAEAGIQRT